MRHLVLLVLVLGCKGGSAPGPGAGSGAGSGPAAAAGDGARAGSGSAAPTGDAGVLDAAAQDAAAAGPTSWKITSKSVAGITEHTPVDRATLEPMFPGFKMTDTETGDAEGGDVFLIEATDPGGQAAFSAQRNDQTGNVSMVTITSPRFVTEAGVKVGDTVKTLLARYDDLECLYEQTEIDELTCSTSELSEVKFHIELRGGRLKLGPIKAKKLAKRAIVTIVWVP